VTARFVVQTTHEGRLWGLQPTGRRVRWDAVMVHRLPDGTIAEQWAAEDWAAILRDVGFVKPPYTR